MSGEAPALRPDTQIDLANPGVVIPRVRMLDHWNRAATSTRLFLPKPTGWDYARIQATEALAKVPSAAIGFGTGLWNLVMPKDLETEVHDAYTLMHGAQRGAAMRDEALAAARRYGTDHPILDTVVNAALLTEDMALLLLPGTVPLKTISGAGKILGAGWKLPADAIRAAGGVGQQAGSYLSKGLAYAANRAGANMLMKSGFSAEQAALLARSGELWSTIAKTHKWGKSLDRLAKLGGGFNRFIPELGAGAASFGVMHFMRPMAPQQDGEGDFLSDLRDRVAGIMGAMGTGAVFSAVSGTVNALFERSAVRTAMAGGKYQTELEALNALRKGQVPQNKHARVILASALESVGMEMGAFLFDPEQAKLYLAAAAGDGEAMKVAIERLSSNFLGTLIMRYRVPIEDTAFYKRLYPELNRLSVRAEHEAVLKAAAEPVEAPIQAQGAVDVNLGASVQPLMRAGLEPQGSVYRTPKGQGVKMELRGVGEVHVRTDGADIQVMLPEAVQKAIGAKSRTLRGDDARQALEDVAMLQMQRRLEAEAAFSARGIRERGAGRFWISEDGLWHYDVDIDGNVVRRDAWQQGAAWKRTGDKLGEMPAVARESIPEELREPLTRWAQVARMVRRLRPEESRAWDLLDRVVYLATRGGPSESVKQLRKALQQADPELLGVFLDAKNVRRLAFEFGSIGTGTENAVSVLAKMQQTLQAEARMAREALAGPDRDMGGRLQEAEFEVRGDQPPPREPEPPMLPYESEGADADVDAARADVERVMERTGGEVPMGSLSEQTRRTMTGREEFLGDIIRYLQMQYADRQMAKALAGEALPMGRGAEDVLREYEPAMQDITTRAAAALRSGVPEEQVRRSAFSSVMQRTPRPPAQPGGTTRQQIGELVRTERQQMDVAAAVTERVMQSARELVYAPGAGEVISQKLESIDAPVAEALQRIAGTRDWAAEKKASPEVAEMARAAAQEYAQLALIGGREVEPKDLVGMFGISKDTARSYVEKARKWAESFGSFLSTRATEAREKMLARWKSQANVGVDPRDVAALAWTGADLIFRGVRRFADWTVQMGRSLGKMWGRLSTAVRQSVFAQSVTQLLQRGPRRRMRRDMGIDHVYGSRAATIARKHGVSWRSAAPTHSNRARVVERDGRLVGVVGRLPTADEFLRLVADNVSAAEVPEILRRLEDGFAALEGRYGREEAAKLLAAWTASNAQKSPLLGLGDLLAAMDAPAEAGKVVELIREGKIRMPSGAAVADMLDAAMGKDTRRFLGDVEDGGAPVPVDHWLARFAGYVDEFTRPLLEAESVDIRGNPSSPRQLPPEVYERVSRHLSDLTAELNERGTFGSLLPHQVAMLAHEATRRAMLGAPEKGVPHEFAQRFRNLPASKQKAVRDIVDKAEDKGLAWRTAMHDVERGEAGFASTALLGGIGIGAFLGSAFGPLGMVAGAAAGVGAGLAFRSKVDAGLKGLQETPTTALLKDTAMQTLIGPKNVGRADAGRVRYEMQQDLTLVEDEAITLAIEGAGDFRDGSTHEQVLARLSPKGQEWMAKVRSIFLSLYDDIAAAEQRGELDHVGFVRNYVPHLYDVSTTKAQQIFDRWRAMTGHFKKRDPHIPTYAAAAEIGLKPKTLRASELLARYINSVTGAMANASFWATLKRMTPPGSAVPFAIKDSDYVEMLKDSPEAVAGYADVGRQYPLTRGWRVHPGLIDADGGWHGNILERVWGAGWDFQERGVGKWLHQLNIGSKIAQLSLSLFHHAALTENVLSAAYDNGTINVARIVREGKKALWESPEGRDAILHGLTVEMPKDVDAGPVGKGLTAFADRIDKMLPIVGNVITKPMRGLLWVNAKNTQLLFHHMQPAFKMFTYKSVLENQLRQWEKAGHKPTADELRQAKYQIAQKVNNVYGGQLWETWWRSNRKAEQGLQWVMLAPDWTLSNIENFRDGFTSAWKGAKSLVGRGERLTAAEKLTLRSALLMMGLSTVGAAMAQFALSMFMSEEDRAAFEAEGRDPGSLLDNDPGKQLGYIRLPFRNEEGSFEYIRPFKQFWEGLGWFDAVDQMRRKMSPVLREAVTQFFGVEGADEFVRPADFADKEGAQNVVGRIVHALGNYTPFSLSGLWSDKPSTQKFFTWPLSRAATDFTVAKMIEDAMVGYAEDVVATDPEGQALAGDRWLTKIQDVLKTARINNVDGELAYQAAYSHASSLYRGKLFEALNEGQMEQAERLAQALQRLGVSRRSIQTSLETRAEKQVRLRKMTEEEALPVLERGAMLGGVDPATQNFALMDERARSAEASGQDPAVAYRSYVEDAISSLATMEGSVRELRVRARQLAEPLLDRWNAVQTLLVPEQRRQNANRLSMGRRLDLLSGQILRRAMAARQRED